ncbi:MFS transporter [Phytoactinopolyspora mesophila]|uniref:MFS transporter n=1 Tax=Phytoactinopolyspora mesophila TaxID=2650750 RepID=A0A7K3M1S5_9ACTN|nr:MFS transporter [Phytoactinopolyspora mesophila]NDL56852.1 MFS transporter [Phytoactinopolyspora mesophila]
MTAERRWSGLVGVLAAQAVSWTGTRVSAIALPWFVLSTTGSAAKTGLVVFVEMMPYVLAQVLSGPIIDRVGPRRISITGDLVSMAVVGLIPLLYAVDMLHFGVLLGLVAVVGAFRGPADASKGVFIPHVTKQARVPLERGTGLTGTIERLASTIGPAMAGLIVAALGGPYALVITAGLFGLGAVIIAVTMRGYQVVADDQPAEPYLARLRAGAGFLRRERLLRSIAGMVAVTNLLDAAWMSVLLPVWAQSSGHGPEVVGLVVGVLSATSILSSLVAAVVAHRLRRRPVYLLGFLIAGGPKFLVLAFGAPLWVVVVVYGIAGLGGGFLNPIIGAIQFERVPPEMYGRVRTMVVAVAWSGVPFGGLVGGGLIALAGLSPALVVCGITYLITTTLPGLQKEWTEMDQERRLARQRETTASH